MKKLLIIAAIALASTVANAAAIGWTLATGSGATYSGDAYALFVIGQNGVSSVDTITALLADSTTYSDYASKAFGSGTINSSGVGTVAATASGKSLSGGTYEGFFVLFDSGTVTEGTKYMVISGQAGMTITFADTAASKSFSSGNVSSAISSGTWATVAPEPTSGLLMLLGMAGLALRRKRA